MKHSKLILILIILLSLLLIGPDSFGQDIKKQAKKAYQDLLKELDKNHDGKISKSEYMTMWKDKNAGEKNWKMWDTNKDGYILEEEYVNAVASIQKSRKKK